MKLKARVDSHRFASNLRVANRLWPEQMQPHLRQALRKLGEEYKFEIASGDVTLLNHRWYVTYVGLLRLAYRRGCSAIQVELIPEFCDPPASHWTFKAIVYKSANSRGFVGYGDADPSNVSTLVRGAEMRVAETRAVNRALRKAYGIGICSVEELGSLSGALQPADGQNKTSKAAGNGHPPLRDRLCLLIRQHQLDAALVKAYAADYCDVAELRQASREQVASFIKHLADYAQNDHEGLLCQLASYGPKPPSEALVQIANTGTNASPATEPVKAQGAA